MSDLCDAIVAAIRDGASTSPEIAAAIGVESTDYQMHDRLNYLTTVRVLTRAVNDAGIDSYTLA